MSKIYATGNEQTDEYGEPTFIDDEKGIDRPTFPVEMALAGMGRKYGEVEKPWHPTAIGANKCEICGQPITTEDAQYWNTEDMYIPKICIKCKHGLVYMGSDLPVRMINQTYLHPEAEKPWHPTGKITTYTPEDTDEYGMPTFVEDEKGIDRPTFPVEMALAGMGRKYNEVEKRWRP